jgi:23S rRNA (guanine1835-N2)-methyltransferase
MQPRSLTESLGNKIRSPLLTVLGSPREVAELLAETGTQEATCYQMDLYQADRLRDELAERGIVAQIVTAADLWDLPTVFQTVLYPSAEGGERDLKIDMVDQAFHLLRLRGQLIVTSAYDKDQLFPGLLKKIFRRIHTSRIGTGTMFWCRREQDRPRRRHEVTFHARIGADPSLRFLSRPGVFSYGRMDDGARALVETMSIEPGDQILDIGCGCGTNGIFAARRSGPEGSVTFADSNVRAIALTEINARENGIGKFEAVASCRLEELREHRFDVALANPPYYAQSAIAELFIERCLACLRPGGRFYLVTKQADQVGPMVAERFGQTEAVERRGYVVLCARKATAC